LTGVPENSADAFSGLRERGRKDFPEKRRAGAFLGIRRRDSRLFKSPNCAFSKRVPRTNKERREGERKPRNYKHRKQ